MTRKHKAGRGRNINRILDNRLWDATRRQWVLADWDIGMDRVRELMADPAVPVGVHRYQETLHWLPVQDRQRVFNETIRPRLVQEIERREAEGDRPASPRVELFQATEWRDRQGAPLLLFEVLH